MARNKEVVIAVVIAVSFLFFLVIVAVAFLGLSESESVPLVGFGKKVAVVDLYGSIEGSSDIVRQIKKYSKDSSVPVILLHIDSPGGLVAPSQEIYQELLKAKQQHKKIVASMGSVAASGGYYVACAADTILANPGTLTGSIGAVLSYLVVEKLTEKIGIEFRL